MTLVAGAELQPRWPQEYISLRLVGLQSQAIVRQRLPWRGHMSFSCPINLELGVWPRLTWSC